MLSASVIELLKETVVELFSPNPERIVRIVLDPFVEKIRLKRTGIVSVAWFERHQQLAYISGARCNCEILLYGFKY